MSKETYQCEGCTHRAPSAVFVALCRHPSSVYKTDSGRDDLHTCAHMRSRGPCGAMQQLFEREV